MSRLPIPASVDASPSASQPLLNAVKQQLGGVPNLFRLVGQSPAALEGYLGLNGALAKGALDVQLRERVALRVAEVNGCEYCLSAHTALGKGVAHLAEGELTAARAGKSSDARAQAALRFVDAVLASRGHVSDAALAEVRAAGFEPPQVLELVAHVALNTLTNYINSVAATDVDFPRVSPNPR